MTPKMQQQNKRLVLVLTGPGVDILLVRTLSHVALQQDLVTHPTLVIPSSQTNPTTWNVVRLPRCAV